MRRDAAWPVRMRFQQLAGPVMAKAVEDTFFYRDCALIGLNEVGGDPLHPGGTAQAFHRRMEQRSRLAPHALSATTTHDTKRGEDARARLNALAEAPAAWCEAAARWRAMHSSLRAPARGRPGAGAADGMDALPGVGRHLERTGAARTRSVAPALFDLRRKVTARGQAAHLLDRYQRTLRARRCRPMRPRCCRLEIECFTTILAEPLRRLSARGCSTDSRRR